MSGTLKQTLYYGCGLVIMKGVSFFMMPVVARYLAPAEYGTLDVMLTLLNVGSLVIGFGMVEAMYRYSGEAQSETDRNRIINTAAVLQVIISIAIFIVLLPFGQLIRDWLPAQISYLQWMLVLTTLSISGCINVPLSWLRVVDKAAEFFAVSTAKAILQAALTWYLLYRGLGINAVLISSLFANCMLAITLAWLQWRSSKGGFDNAIIPRLLRYGYPLVFSGVLAFLANGFEKWIIADTFNTQTLAQYAIAIQFATMIAFLAEPFTLWWFPKRFAILHSRNGNQKTIYYAQLGCLLSFIIALIIGLLGPVVIISVLPIHYHPAAKLIPWLCAGMALKQCSHLLSTGCYVRNSTLIVLKINAATAVVAIFIFSVAARYLGMVGIVCAFILVNFFRLLLYVIISQKILPLNYSFRRISLFYLAVIGLLALPLTLPTQNLSIAYALLVSAAVAGIVLFYCLNTAKLSALQVQDV